ncbi:hypothetical protein H0I76_17440 [Limibaculum sp. M0105]|uniref:Uncharacterized protein n=1 Tax=Thermohalobaculum xanthum TaxID=2753746 RepID=A0A8J7M9S5_9RHOB|nr:hypothetical protein [Thermohalobaculum xanthum]MBK0400986.1 hypothetical protein [Thermohalobaculum xanthum]
MTMENEATSEPEKSQEEAASSLNEDFSIKRLRASRMKYRQKLEIDAKKSGAEWLMAYASYEQIIFLHAVKAGKHKDRDEMQLDNSIVLFDEIDKQIPRVSTVPRWSRDDIWFETFIDSVLERWSEVSDKVEIEECG